MEDPEASVEELVETHAENDDVQGAAGKFTVT